MIESESLVNFVIFFIAFLAISATLEIFSRKTTFPFTVAILLGGFGTQFLLQILGIENSIPLVPEIVYYFVLPILLFESAIHINFHQFRLQFKTISFLSTFGLLTSVFIIAFATAIFLDLPLGVAFLFGTIISATDPIAVISLFKNLGGPRRLQLLAEGESMFNDATAVILFRLVSGIAILNNVFSVEDIVFGASSFLLVFMGSILAGVVIGYIGSIIISNIRDDTIAETTITAVIAVSSFILAEHFLPLSGVISTVITGITIGNFGKTKFSFGVVKFIDQFWEYVGFFAVSFVFFVTALNLDWRMLTDNIGSVAIIIVIVLLARAISTYITFAITNNTPLFVNEPNVPLKWQHIINWGGMRGVIPLVLVYSLDDSFAYKTEFLVYTLSTLTFSLLINGTTIKWLMMKLDIHLPEKEELINEEEDRILELEDARLEIKNIKSIEFDNEVIRKMEQKILEEEKCCKENLYEMIDDTKLEKSLKIKAILIEEKVLDEFFKQGYISENVYFKFQSELYLQKDAIEFPDVETGRTYTRGGFINSEKIYENSVSRLKKLSHKIPLLKKLIESRRSRLVEERIMLLRTRITSSKQVIDYMERLEEVIADENQLLARKLGNLIKEQVVHIDKNQEHMNEIEKNFPKILENYQQRILHSKINFSI